MEEPSIWSPITVRIVLLVIVGNFFMGIYRYLFFHLFNSNGIQLIILFWLVFISPVWYWPSHINHLFVGMYNLPYQIWVFPENFCENMFIYKLITVRFSVSFISTFLVYSLTCQTMQWAIVILLIIMLHNMHTSDCIIGGV